MDFFGGIPIFSNLWPFFLFYSNFFSLSLPWYISFRLSWARPSSSLTCIRSLEINLTLPFQEDLWWSMLFFVCFFSQLFFWLFFLKCTRGKGKIKSPKFLYMGKKSKKRWKGRIWKPKVMKPENKKIKEKAKEIHKASKTIWIPNLFSLPFSFWFLLFTVLDFFSFFFQSLSLSLFLLFFFRSGAVMQTNLEKLRRILGRVFFSF